MISLEEARNAQREKQKKSVTVFLTALLIAATVCIVLYFLYRDVFYIGLVAAIFVICYMASRTKIFDLFRPREVEGEVVYYLVRTEMVKASLSDEPGETYRTYTVYRADITLMDKKGKKHYKTFSFTAEYDDVRVGDKATFLRFVDRPVVVFQK